ncbi:MAG: dipeptide ABC transporter ATP-binding protein [Oligoflexales bacterium]|nr:dipeptide ABC transporter ATP-binding protein [Oligoflexales bacterium]
MKENLVEVENLRKVFPIYGGIFYRKVAEVHALNGVSFSVNEGETLGIVGESGCGKSTLAKTLLRLYRADGGRALFLGRDLFSLDSKNMFEMRKNIQMIFQDPYSSLNPRMTIGDIIREPLDIYKVGDRRQREGRVEEMIDIVGMRKNVLSRYPHEFSGGQRQRIGIARSIILKPKLVIADEPVSALDVSIQSQIINLMSDLQREFKLTFIFIAHDLSVVEYVSDRVAVMYLGHIVEISDRKSLFENPAHPYTESLLSAIPVKDPRQKKRRVILEGDVPSPISLPKGCPFHARCPRVMDACRAESPVLSPLSSASSHKVACFKADKK